MLFKITVEKVEGSCAAGYSPGNSFEIEGFTVPAGQQVPICIHALLAMSGILMELKGGASPRDLGIGPDNRTAFVACPDPGPPYTMGGRVVFRITRVGDEED